MPVSIVDLARCAESRAASHWTQLSQAARLLSDMPQAFSRTAVPDGGGNAGAPPPLTSPYIRYVSRCEEGAFDC